MNKRVELLIGTLKARLEETDYKEFKNSRGEYSTEEWEGIHKEREAIRKQISELKKQ